MNPPRRHSESGAVFIHVAIGLLVFLMFVAFVADYGMLWASRAQAQNAADAGALSGAAALSFDATAGDRWDRARNVAWNASYQHGVWGDSPGVVPVSPYSGSPCADNPERCVRVDVFRDGTNGSALLPTWFASLFGVNDQKTRAMAVAETAPASGTDCLKPWLIPDRFENLVGDEDTFDEGDNYTRPTLEDGNVLNYGTGYTPLDIGTTLTLRAGNPNQAIAPGNYYEIDDPEFDVIGGADYATAIAECVLRRSIGQEVSVLNGRRQGPTRDGFERLMAGRESAIVIIGMFDPADWEARERDTGNQDIEIVNMLAFEVRADSLAPSGEITGTIVGAPSDMLTLCTTAPCPISTGLVSVIRLIR